MLREAMAEELVHIKAIFSGMKGAYGWPRIWRELSERGIRTGKERVRKLMKAHGLAAPDKMSVTRSPSTPSCAPCPVRFGPTSIGCAVRPLLWPTSNNDGKSGAGPAIRLTLPDPKIILQRTCGSTT
jgi:hypothetical protein